MVLRVEAGEEDKGHGPELDILMQNHECCRQQFIIQDKRFMTLKQWKRLLHLAIMHVTSNKEDKKCLHTLILQQFPTTSEVTLTSDYGDQQVRNMKIVVR